MHLEDIVGKRSHPYIGGFGDCFQHYTNPKAPICYTYRVLISGTHVSLNHYSHNLSGTTYSISLKVVPKYVGPPAIGYLRYAGSSTSTLLDSTNMARPRVQPANRLRVTTACTACRKSKKRCSGSFPCTNCIHKGCGGSCTPFKSASRSHQAASRPSARSTETESGKLSKAPFVSQNHNVLTPHREIDTLELGSHSPEATHRTHPRMLRNLQGERGR